MNRLPEERLADSIVASRGLFAPVDVLSLLSEYADVEASDELHQHGIDGLLVDNGTGGRRPTVYFDATVHTVRQRFTLAHELGHLLIPWHVGTKFCTPDEAPDGGLEEEMSRELADVPHRLEVQADRFAAALLIPQRWVLDLRSSSLEDAIGELELANVSLQAALRSLAQIRLSGTIVAALDDSSRVIASYRSPGTPGSGISNGSRVPREVVDGADQKGRCDYLGRPLVWFTFDQVPSHTPQHSWRYLLSAILAKRPSSDRPRLWASAAAVSSSVNSTAALASTVADTATRIRTSFRLNADLCWATDDPLFEQYAVSRAWAFTNVIDTKADG